MNQAEDVEVILGHERRYKFHSGTLARNSILLADLLTETNAVKLSNRAKNAGIKTRWMIELKDLPSEQYPAGRLDLVVCDYNPHNPSTIITLSRRATDKHLSRTSHHSVSALTVAMASSSTKTGAFPKPSRPSSTTKASSTPSTTKSSRSPTPT
jgi:hypothetical protein